MLQTPPIHRMARAGQSVPAAPKVSVVMPTRNRAFCLGEAIDSIRAQTFQDWELIVVDDGSDDETGDVVRRYCAQDSRIRYVRQPHGGCAPAQNMGLRLVRGEYLSKLDDDDVAHADLLAICAAALDANPEHWAVNFSVGIYRGNREKGWNLLTSLHNDPLFFRVSALRALKGWDEFYPLFEDNELSARSWLYRGWKAVVLEQILYEYRMSGNDNAGQRVSALAGYGYKYLLARNRQLARWGVLFRPLASQTLRKAAAMLSTAHWHNGFLPSARFAHWQQRALEEVRAVATRGLHRDIFSLLEVRPRFPWGPLWRAERALWQRLHLLRMPLSRRAEAMWALAHNHYFRRDDKK